MQKESLAKSSEDSGRIASALEGLYEGMDKFPREETFGRWRARWRQCVRFQSQRRVLGSLSFGPAIPPTGFQRHTQYTQYGWCGERSCLSTAFGAASTSAGYASSKLFVWLPARAGEAPMLHPVNMEVPFMKGTSVKVIDEGTGRVRTVFPNAPITSQHGDGSFCPFGVYVPEGNFQIFRRNLCPVKEGYA